VGFVFFSCPRWALPHLLLYYKLVRLPYQAITLLFALVIPFRNSKALPSSMTIISCLPATVLDPGNPDIYSPYRLYQFRLPVSENLGQLLNRLISGLPTFTLVVADRLLPYSFIVFVTLHYVQFRSRLVVNLYLGWLLQLDCLSLPWHTHCSRFTDYPFPHVPSNFIKLYPHQNNLLRSALILLGVVVSLNLL